MKAFPYSTFLFQDITNIKIFPVSTITMKIFFDFPNLINLVLLFLQLFIILSLLNKGALFTGTIKLIRTDNFSHFFLYLAKRYENKKQKMLGLYNQILNH